MSGRGESDTPNKPARVRESPARPFYFSFLSFPPRGSVYTPCLLPCLGPIAYSPYYKPATRPAYYPAYCPAYCPVYSSVYSSAYCSPTSYFPPNISLLIAGLQPALTPAYYPAYCLTYSSAYCLLIALLAQRAVHFLPFIFY